VNKKSLIFAIVASAIVVIGFVVLSFWQIRHELSQTQSALSDARDLADQNQAQLALLKNQRAQDQTLIESLQQEKEASTQAQKKLEDQMRDELQSKDITISELQGKLTVNILDRILFDSGEAVLKPEGQNILQQIANVLKQYPNRQIHVIGHTDNVPIKTTARSRFSSNWELSTARANAAVRFLCETAGVDPRRLGAVGYGEFHPIADNATQEGRAQNRRIALVVLSEELVGSDTTANAATNRAPVMAPTPHTNSVAATHQPVALLPNTNGVSQSISLPADTNTVSTNDI
jgi:chemotaxis protein MotB